MATGDYLTLNGAGAQVNLRAEVGNDGSVAVHSVPEVNGLPVTSLNPMPVFSTAGAVTAAAPSAFSVATGGTAVTVFAANSIVTQGVIINPQTAQENLYIDLVNTPGLAAPGANGTTLALLPGAEFRVPGGLTNAVKVNAALSGHAFTAFSY